MQIKCPLSAARILIVLYIIKQMVHNRITQRDLYLFPAIIKRLAIGKPLANTSAGLSEKDTLPIQTAYCFV